jgi:N-methylhydantoinase B/oxoprolinase/acetone carboxylase alpha subunit
VASAEARSVYEEGTRVPHMRLREGQIDEKIFAIIMANSRNPIEARVTVADRLQRRAARLADMMRSSSRLDRRAGAVILTSREATREAIRKRRAAVQDATCSTGTTPTIPRSRSAT